VSEIEADIRRIPQGKITLHRILRKSFGDTESKALTLKICNLLLARHHARHRSTRVTSRPFGLVLDPSNMCQLACPGCVHSTRNESLGLFDWKPGTLSETRFSALLRTYGPWATGVYMCNYGEPLLNLSTPKLIRMCKSYLLHVALSSSMSVKRFDAGAYASCGLDVLNMSIDGATQETYGKYRRNGNIELVFENIEALVAARRRLGKDTPVMAWNFLAFDHNKHEIPLAAAKARQLGVDQFRVFQPFDVSWDDPNVRAAADVHASLTRFNWLATPALSENWNPSPESLESAIIDQAFDEPLLPPEDPPLPVLGHTCSWLYKNIVMDATGRILPCCCAPQPQSNLVFTHFDPTGPEPLADPFNSHRHEQARAFFAGTHETSADSPYCTRCAWNQETVNVGPEEVKRYLQFAGPGLFDSRTLDLLTNW
jgi:MoaA/NifB/PqqE/SkfB family radical SAM enzyme